MNGNNKFTVMFVKPDALNDGLTGPILDDFAEAGLVPVYRKLLNLDQNKAMMVYRDHMGNQNYRFAVNSLMEESGCKTCLMLLLKREDGEALSVAQKIKGRADKDGVRAKYRRYLWTDLMEKGIEGEELKTMLSRNRVHVPDSDEHVCEIMMGLLDNSEMEEVAVLDPELVDFVRGCGGEIGHEGRHIGKERL
jgi:nucleoside diphosphate kinase